MRAYPVREEDGSPDNRSSTWSSSTCLATRPTRTRASCDRHSRPCTTASTTSSMSSTTCCTPTGPEPGRRSTQSAPRTAYDPPKKSTMIFTPTLNHSKELRATPTREIKTPSQNSADSKNCSTRTSEAPEAARRRARTPSTAWHPCRTGRKSAGDPSAPHLNSSSTGCATGNRSASRCSESRDRLSCTILP